MCEHSSSISLSTPLAVYIYGIYAIKKKKKSVDMCTQSLAPLCFSQVAPVFDVLVQRWSSTSSGSLCFYWLLVRGLNRVGVDNVLSQTHWVTESQIFLLSSHCAAQTAAFIYIPVPSQCYLTLLGFFFSSICICLSELEQRCCQQRVFVCQLCPEWIVSFPL